MRQGLCFACSPPPKGSSLYQRLIILGRGAMAYGKFSVAKDCFEAAGACASLARPCDTRRDCVPLRSGCACISEAAINRTAGQWEELLPLCAFQGDFAVLRSFANKAPAGSQGAYDGPLVRVHLYRATTVHRDGSTTSN